MAGLLQLGNAEIGFRNFEGQEGAFNKAGDRNFVAFLEPEYAHQLEAEGWNVKWPKERDDLEDDQRRPYLPIAIGYKAYPPVIYLINGTVKTELHEDTIGQLDWAELENVDLVIRPYVWSVNGQSGIKAYLKTGYFTIVQDDFASKYDF